MTAEEKYTAFDAYIAGTIDDPTRRDLERRMKENSALREEFEIYRAARQSVIARSQWESEAQPFLGTLQELSKTHFPAQRGGAQIISLAQRRLVLRLVSAAAILLLIVMIWQPWQQDLYTRYARHPQAAFAARSGAGMLSASQQAFNARDFAAAREGFGRYLAENPDDLEVVMFYGISALELEEYNIAQQQFHTLRTSPSFSDEGTWYLALTFLKSGTPDSTRFYLHDINRTSPRYRDAQRLLRAVK